MASKRKPTNKEMTNAIMNNHQKINDCIQFMNRIDNVLGLYIDYNKNTKKFSEFVINKMKEAEKLKEENNDSKGNGKADKPNLQGDTDGKSSGTERVRKKAK